MNALIFGATGAIGEATAAKLEERGARVITSSRAPGGAELHVDPAGTPETISALNGLRPLEAVVWAQGANINDSAHTVDTEGFATVLDANIGFIVVTLQQLLAGACLSEGASLVMVSSIWENLARPGKFSYGVSKAAVGGLVRAASADLAKDGFRVNAVLPGVTDTPMTRSVLSSDRIAAVERAVGLDRLVTLDEVASTIAWLCSSASSGISGQSLAVDLGFSNVRDI